MTQYTSDVELAKLRIEAEAKMNLCVGMEARDGRIDYSYANGREVRLFHRDFEIDGVTYKQGTQIILAKGDTLEQMMSRG